jgi:SLAP domain-containing protein
MDRKLQFHDAWKKQLSPQDAEMITQLFHKAVPEQNMLSFDQIKIATNYKGDLIATVLIHNTTSEEQSLTNLYIKYLENGRTIASHMFTVPFSLKRNESMPWAFIFPHSLIKEEKITKLNWDLKLDDNVTAEKK